MDMGLQCYLILTVKEKAVFGQTYGEMFETLCSGETVICVEDDQIHPVRGDEMLFPMREPPTLIEGDRDTHSEDSIRTLQCCMKGVLGISGVCVAPNGISSGSYSTVLQGTL